MLRILTGVVLLVILWASVMPSPPIAFVALMAVAITIGSFEAASMMRAMGLRPLAVIGLLTVWGIVGAVAFEPQRYATVMPLALGLIAILVGAMATRDSPLAILKTTGATMLPVLIGLLLSYAIALRNQPDVGRELLVLLFLAVVAGDTAAFYVGKNFGRHKLAPSLSPKKTWEGAIGGVTAAVVVVVVFQQLRFPELGLVHAAILGVLLSSAGILGDLTESLVKRAAGVKDSSGLLPGHGGVLDRTDSLLFTGPILYYYYNYFVA